jgi:hypothetical protein
MSCPVLWAVPGEPDQLVRLTAFRAAHADVRIYPVHRDVWQADISEPDGQTVITRYTLRELLDRLHELDEQASGEPGVPGGPAISWPRAGGEGRWPPVVSEATGADEGTRAISAVSLAVRTEDEEPSALAI